MAREPQRARKQSERSIIGSGATVTLLPPALFFFRRALLETGRVEAFGKGAVRRPVLSLHRCFLFSFFSEKYPKMRDAQTSIISYFFLSFLRPSYYYALLCFICYSPLRMGIRLHYPTYV